MCAFISAARNYGRITGSLKEHASGSGGRARCAWQAAAAAGMKAAAAGMKAAAAAAGAPQAYPSPSSSSVCQVASLQQGMGSAKSSAADHMEVEGPYHGPINQQAAAIAAAHASGFTFPQLAPVEQVHNPFAAAAAGADADQHAGSSSSNSLENGDAEAMDTMGSAVLDVHVDTSSEDSASRDEIAAAEAPIRQGPSLLQGSNSGSIAGAGEREEHAAAAGGFTQQRTAAVGGFAQQRASGAGGFAQQHTAIAGGLERRTAAGGCVQRAVQQEQVPPAAPDAWQTAMVQQQQAASTLCATARRTSGPGRVRRKNTGG